MNSSWLSTVFKKEVGISVSEYIKEKKINAAKYLLTFNEYSCTDIAEYEAFRKMYDKSLEKLSAFYNKEKMATVSGVTFIL